MTERHCRSPLAMSAITILKGWFVLLEGEVGEKQELRVPRTCNLNFHYFVHYFIIIY